MPATPAILVVGDRTGYLVIVDTPERPGLIVVARDLDGRTSGAAITDSDAATLTDWLAARAAERRHAHPTPGGPQ